jgi:hypothetical protein
LLLAAVVVVGLAAPTRLQLVALVEVAGLAGRWIEPFMPQARCRLRSQSRSATVELVGLLVPAGQVGFRRLAHCFSVGAVAVVVADHPLPPAAAVLVRLLGAISLAPLGA